MDKAKEGPRSWEAHNNTDSLHEEKGREGKTGKIQKEPGNKTGSSDGC